MKFLEALNKVRKTKVYTVVMYLVPPLYLFELWLWVQAFLAAVLLMPVIIGFFMIPSFPVELSIKEN